MHRIPVLVAFAAASVTFAAGVPAQQPAQVTAAGAAAEGSAAGLAAQLRTLYFQQDFEGAQRLGATAGAAASDDPEARAWHVIGMARSSLEKEAVAAADAMVERWRDDAWPYIARSVAVSYDGRTKDAVDVAARATELAPDNPYSWWALGLARHRAAEYDAVAAMVDSVFPGTFDWAELLVLKANALMVQAGREQDTLKLNHAHELFAEARERDPSNVNANFFPASNLINRSEHARGLELMERTLELAPYSSSILAAYWRGMNARRDMPAEEKRAAIIASTERVLAARGGYPGALSGVANIYRTLEEWDRLARVEERILEEAPESTEAEWVLVNRQRAIADSIFQGTMADTADGQARLREMMWSFLDRPTHRRPQLLGDVYLSLFHRIRGDSTVANEDLLRVAQGMAKYNRINPHTTHSAGPAALAERGVYFREAEAIVREGLEFIDEYMAERESMFTTVGEYADAEDRLKATHYAALGWIYFQEGRLEDAERELDRAHEISRNSGPVLYYLGRLAQAKGELEQAEIYYSRGYAQEVRGGAKSSTQALESLYRELHGSMEGWDAYIEELAERDRQQRRAKIAESRIAEPEEAAEFELEWLHGGTFSTRELAGKIAVINFWGVWCGPCVKEAPDIQRFHEKFKDDPNVVFLTIDNDADVDMVRRWMAEKKYDFPVLIDDGYVRRANVNAFPTTWFIDPDGRIIYTHIGASDVVFEEFVWRVELLREAMTVMQQEP